MNVCKVACRVAYELIGKHLPVSYHIGGKMASKIRYRMVKGYISSCGSDVNFEHGADVSSTLKIGNNLRIVFRVAGKGTEEFSKMKAGEYLDIQGPLGNGYDLGKIAAELKADGRSFDKAILFGGGIGVPPMLELARRLDCHKNVVVGYRNSQTFLKEDFEAVADTDVYIATEDGSVGAKGNVLDAVKQEKVEADVIFACGPTPMLRAIKAYALENDIPCYVSLEEKMACGIGACLACVCKSTEIDDHSQVKNKRVCKEGPVFNVKEVEL